MAGEYAKPQVSNYEEDVNPVRSALAASGGRSEWTLVGAAFALPGYLHDTLHQLPHQAAADPRRASSRACEYWFLQHSEARGNQPLFYYLLLMPIYEPLALFAGLGTMIYMVVKWIKGEGDTAISADSVDVVPSSSDELVEDNTATLSPALGAMRGLTLGFLAFWSFGAFIAFSLAGEKMPWLNMQIALPFSYWRLRASASCSRAWSGVRCARAADCSWAWQ